MRKDTVGRLTMRLGSLCILVAAAMLVPVSCVRDNNVPDNMADMVTLYPVVSNGIETTVSTRAAATYSITDAPGTRSYRDSVPMGTSIKVYAVPNTTEQPVFQGFFNYSEEGWKSTVAVKSNYTYSLYAHSPATLPGASDMTFDRVSQSLSFSRLNVITPFDPWVSVAVLSKEVNNDVTTPPESLKWHNFNIGYIEPLDVVGQRRRKVWMAMDHLFAKATVSFHVDSTYNSIRTIRLREAAITTSNGVYQSTYTYSFADGLTIAGGSLQSQSISFNLLDVEGTTVNDTIKRMMSNDGYVTLGTDTTEFAWFCFLPYEDKLPADIRLNVKYDIYNKADSLIRKEETATNAFPLANTHPQAGHDYKINICVNPSYIYVLADSDADQNIDFTTDLE